MQRPSTHSGPSGCPSQSMSSTHPAPPLELPAPVPGASVVVVASVDPPSPVVGTLIAVLTSPVSLVVVSTGMLSPNDPPVPLPLPPPPPLQAVRTMHPNAAPQKPWIIDASAAELGVDSARIVLGGFSQGAAAAIAVSAKLDRRLGGLLIQSGFVPEVFDNEIDLTAIGAQAVLIQHGSGDEVVPVHSALDLSAMFDTIAIDSPGPLSKVELQITGGGHTVSDAMAAAADAWLRSLVSE